MGRTIRVLERVMVGPDRSLLVVRTGEQVWRSTPGWRFAARRKNPGRCRYPALPPGGTGPGPLLKRLLLSLAITGVLAACFTVTAHAASVTVDLGSGDGGTSFGILEALLLVTLLALAPSGGKIRGVAGIRPFPLGVLGRVQFADLFDVLGGAPQQPNLLPGPHHQQRAVGAHHMGQEAMVVEAIKLGAMDFIVKPFKPDRILQTVQKILG